MPFEPLKMFASGAACCALALCLAWMSLAVLCWDMALVRLLDRPRWRGWLQRRVGALDRLCGVLLLALGGWLVLAAL